MGVQSGKRGRKNLRMRRTILLSTTVGMILAAPQSNPVWTEVIGEYKGEPLKVVRPTTEAALAFMKDFFGEDLCSSAAQAYMESRGPGGAWKSLCIGGGLVQEQLRLRQGHGDQRCPRLGKVLAGVGGGQPLLGVHQHLHGVDHRRQVHQCRLL